MSELASEPFNTGRPPAASPSLRGDDDGEFAARGIVHGTGTGAALISPEPISFLGDLDIATGEVVNVTSSIRGQSVAGRVLFIPYSVGSAGAWRFLYQLFVHGTNPVAVVQQSLPDSSLVQGAILAGVPIVCDPDSDLFSTVRPGDKVEVDGTQGLVRITANGDAVASA